MACLQLTSIDMLEEAAKGAKQGCATKVVALYCGV